MNDGGLFSFQQEQEYEQRYHWELKNIPDYMKRAFPDETKNAEDFANDIFKLTKQEQDEIYDALFFIGAEEQLLYVSKSKKEKEKISKELSEIQLKYLKKYLRFGLRVQDIVQIIAGR